MRKRSRSGISNLLGAIFFVLVVGLVISTLALIFSSSSAFIGGIHSSATSGVQNTNTLIDVSNMTFGATYASASASIPLSSSPSRPLLPITNMNFSDGDSGWYVSQSFSVLHDNASVSSTNSTDIVQLPASGVGFTLSVTDDDAPGTQAVISKVTLLVDSNFSSVAGLAPGGLASGWTNVRHTGNNITWYPSSAFNGLLPGQTGTFPWTASVPATIGEVYDTVVVSWYSSLGANPFIGRGIATVNSNSTLVGTNVFEEAGTSTSRVQGSNQVGVPGGLSAGYDADALSTSSDSGPGSMYVSFAPTMNSAPLATGDQLTARVRLTTTFNLTSNVRVSPGTCCSASWYADLVSLTAAHNPLIYYHVYLQNTSKIWVLLDQNGTNPTLLNYFQPSGWQRYTTSFEPAGVPTVLQAGRYNLTVSVSMTMPSGTGSGVTMDFDDIGLAITPSAATAYGSQQVPLQVHVNQSLVQGLTVGATFTTGLPANAHNSTVYLFAEDFAKGALCDTTSECWTEIGSAFVNYSASLSAYIPPPNAAYFVDPTGRLNLLITVVAPSACVSCSSMSVDAYAVTASTNQSLSVVTLRDVQGSTPVHLATLYVSGPNMLASTPVNTYVSDGDDLIIALGPSTAPGFSWIPGQTYSVTVTTTNGLSYARSFVAPSA